jgi:hypothetical protein
VINNINSNMVAVGGPCKIIRNNMKINGLCVGGGYVIPFYSAA